MPKEHRVKAWRCSWDAPKLHLSHRLAAAKREDFWLIFAGLEELESLMKKPILQDGGIGLYYFKMNFLHGERTTNDR
ncbi:MAG: hypothetical protein RBS31_02390 [Candidatus Syntrophosphaera sp.]|nr:hypothetical protein [Candidatus Cloacimonadota bacterium]MDX9949311.1 hypothetical protein [Candidatus Syntrophosphaera sp.]